MSTALLLPHARLDTVGINLEDFLRQVLMAAKSARAENLHFPLYPLSLAEEGSPLAFPDNTHIARYSENRLGRFIILPQEAELTRLYRSVVRDAERCDYPRRWHQESFYERYLAHLEFPTLTLAFDAVLWFLLRRTTRTLPVADTLRVVHSFFLDEDILFTGQRTQVVKEQFAYLTDADFRRWDMTMELASVIFSSDKTWVVVSRDDAPLEGRNTYFVEFRENPPSAQVTTFLPENEYSLVKELPTYRTQIEEELRASFKARFGESIVKAARIRETSVEAAAS